MGATFKYTSKGTPEINGVAVPHVKEFTVKAGGEAGPYVEVEVTTAFLVADLDTEVSELVLLLPDGRRFRFTGVTEV